MIAMGKGIDRRVCIGHVHLKVADIDRDGAIGLSDLARLLSSFSQASGATIDDGDLDEDGDVDLLDLSSMLAVFSSACP